jgi:hypothetical protein
LTKVTRGGKVRALLAKCVQLPKSTIPHPGGLAQVLRGGAEGDPFLNFS